MKITAAALRLLAWMGTATKEYEAHLAAARTSAEQRGARQIARRDVLPLFQAAFKGYDTFVATKIKGVRP